MTSLRSPSLSSVEEITPMTMAVASKALVTEHYILNYQQPELGAEILTLRPIAFYDLLAIHEVVVAFAQQIGVYTE